MLTSECFRKVACITTAIGCVGVGGAITKWHDALNHGSEATALLAAAKQSFIDHKDVLSLHTQALAFTHQSLKAEARMHMIILGATAAALAAVAFGASRQSTDFRRIEATLAKSGHGVEPAKLPS